MASFSDWLTVRCCHGLLNGSLISDYLLLYKDQEIILVTPPEIKFLSKRFLSFHHTHVSLDCQDLNQVLQESKMWW